MRNQLSTALAIALGLSLFSGQGLPAMEISVPLVGEDVFAYMQRVAGGFDQGVYRAIVGAANEFKEGDAIVGVAATGDQSRAYARMLLESTRIADIQEHPLFEDGIQRTIWAGLDKEAASRLAGWTLGELRRFILTAPEAEIHALMGGLDSDTIACLVRIMSNADLTAAGARIFNPLPGSTIGSKGRLGARIQPNSPTDNPEDIIWQVFSGWSYATGDVVLGTNPVSGKIEDLAQVESALRDLVETFGLEDILPWCVLAHIDLQAALERASPGSTALWFQSLAGNDQASRTFDIDAKKMLDYAGLRSQKFGMYFETGQGADFTNGAGQGVDMVVHESRKYGLARALKARMVEAGNPGWTIVNDVAGFIGPEVFRDREQLVRTCLEDIVMGKLHGLCIGLDICSTLHMPVTLEDLEWCQDRIVPAAPAYLMALPTRNDPMLSYLTTSFQDHVRLRARFDLEVDESMKAFFRDLGILDAQGGYTEHAGDPLWVYWRYRQAKGDTRSRKEIYIEGEAAIARVEARGVPVARGHGVALWDLRPETAARIEALYRDAKLCIRSQFSPAFKASIPNTLNLATQSKDRDDYLGHPASGEKLSPASVAALQALRASWGSQVPDVQIVVSDGLNANAIMDEGHIQPYLQELSAQLAAAGFYVGQRIILLDSGRVRAGYAIGSILFGKVEPGRPRIIVHAIGERPGTEHRSFSVYLAGPDAPVWATGAVDHDIAMVISGISDTSYLPKEAAKETLRIIRIFDQRIAQGR